MERQEIGLEHLKGTKVQYIWSCGLDTNALRAATASADFSSKVWDASTGVELHWFEHKHIVRACAFSEIGHFTEFTQTRREEHVQQASER
ncbi:hypothetical protein QN277_005561 [Acacia crassicarpa]|uniref:Uncharacterized protein n=1 Tax=Acacia crassicarpa TaxID=499986 RepID=A0AAE1JX97_9FABA|nr:hypothetical protein QN277_005561 [Acacia crassicarpa]